MRYHTKDILLAAYLHVKGYKVTEITVDGTRGTFHFQDVPPQLILEYDMGEGLVEPHAFNSAIKQLTTAVRRQS